MEQFIDGDGRASIYTYLTIIYLHPLGICTTTREPALLYSRYFEARTGKMDMSDDWETTEVLICGCGPTGAMLSGYLGRMSVSNIVLEKEASINTDPRGIALDDDGIRFMQGLGLYKPIFTEIGACKIFVAFDSDAADFLRRCS